MPTSSPNPFLLVTVTDHFDDSTTTGATDKVVRVAATKSTWTIKTAALANRALLGEVNLGDMVTRAIAADPGGFINGTAARVPVLKYIAGNSTSLRVRVFVRVGASRYQVGPTVTINPAVEDLAVIRALVQPSLDFSLAIDSNGTGGETIGIQYQSVEPSVDLAAELNPAEGFVADLPFSADVATGPMTLSVGIIQLIEAPAELGDFVVDLPESPENNERVGIKILAGGAGSVSVDAPADGTTVQAIDGGIAVTTGGFSGPSGGACCYIWQAWHVDGDPTDVVWLLRDATPFTV
jgi:hypothetical protein